MGGNKNPFGRHVVLFFEFQSLKNPVCLGPGGSRGHFCIDLFEQRRGYSFWTDVLTLCSTNVEETKIGKLPADL